MMKPIAIVTGASTGIGRSLAIKLSSTYLVYLVSRNIDKLKKVSDEILAMGNECKIVVADITKHESASDIYSKINNKQSVELLINNAGKAIFKDISNMSIDDWDDQINVNLRGAFIMSKMFIDDLKSKKNGTIVFTNSVAGLQPYKNSTAYVASKHGLRGFASSLREELREYNIKVISVYPGAIDTPLWDDMEMDSLRPEMMSSDDVADIVVNSINSPNNCTVEEIVLRRVQGDF